MAEHPEWATYHEDFEVHGIDGSFTKVPTGEYMASVDTGVRGWHIIAIGRSKTDLLKRMSLRVYQWLTNDTEDGHWPW